MDSVSSVLNAPFVGLQQAQTQMNQAASVIADPTSASSVVTLSTAVVAMKEANISFAANIKSIQAQNEALGTLIDLMA